MPKWEGKSRGTVLGYKILFFLLKKPELKQLTSFSILLLPTILFFSKKQSSHLYYFKERLGYSYFKSKKWFTKATTLLGKPY